MIVLTASSKQFRLDIVELCCSLQRSVRPRMQEAGREGHRARVAECAISATHNSLKSQRARNLKSPISNDRAITSKLCIRSRLTAVKAAPPVHHRPRLRALALLGRRPHQRVEGHVIPASEKPTHDPTYAVQQTARKRLYQSSHRRSAAILFRGLRRPSASCQSSAAACRPARDA